MTDVIENTILEDGNIKITNLRAIMGSKTYAMSNVTSVSLVKRDPSSAPILWAIVGVLFVLISFFSFRDFYGCFLLGLLLAVGGVLGARNAKPTYLVQIGSASGEMKLLGSTDKAHIKKIVDAMNEAIVRRG